jgi:hypothetical protein
MATRWIATNPHLSYGGIAIWSDAVAPFLSARAARYAIMSAIRRTLKKMVR